MLGLVGIPKCLFSHAAARFINMYINMNISIKRTLSYYMHVYGFGHSFNHNSKSVSREAEMRCGLLSLINIFIFNGTVHYEMEISRSIGQFLNL